MNSSRVAWMSAAFLFAALSASAAPVEANMHPAIALASLADMETASTPGDDELNGAAQLSAGNAAYGRGDYAAAFGIYRKIAVLGFSEAHYRLGLMCAKGLGTRKSIKQAEYWLRLAATQHYPGAEEALAAIRSGAPQI